MNENNQAAADVVPIRETVLPTEIDEEDALRLEKISLERDLFITQMSLLEEHMSSLREKLTAHTERGNAFGLALRAKYHIADADNVDVGARKIVRQ